MQKLERADDSHEGHRIVLKRTITGYRWAWAEQTEASCPEEIGPDLSRYPHTCPRCGDAAYLGAGGPADCIRGYKCK